MKRPIFFDRVLEDHFIEKGFSKVKLMDAEAMARIVEGFNSLRPADNYDPVNNKMNAHNASSYHCTFLDTDPDYKRGVQELIERECKPAIDAFVDNYKILTANFYVKQPGSGEFQIHSNWPTAKHFEETSVTVWIPLQDVDATNGGIHIVEGSHKIVPDVACLQSLPYFHNFEAALKEKYLKPVPLKAGEAIIFCDTLLHWSPKNNSDKIRAAIQIEMLPEECSPVVFWMDKDHPENGLELYELYPEFYHDHSITAFRERPTMLRKSGWIKNPNRMLTEEQFLVKMAEGPETRRKFFYTRDRNGTAIPVVIPISDNPEDEVAWPMPAPESAAGAAAPAKPMSLWRKLFG